MIQLIHANDKPDADTASSAMTCSDAKLAPELERESIEPPTFNCNLCDDTGRIYFNLLCPKCVGGSKRVLVQWE